MKVLKFYTKSEKKIERVIWYINDRTTRSSIIRKVENHLRVNELICLLDVAQLYHNREEFEAEEKKKFVVPKDRIDYLRIGEE